ncbi:MAG: hypothetical protein HN729_12610 [Candidatus Marinimicrobia bacterium]|jgi:hypothetical protein|nr:hypothetical protein [Candidatus Neomarinimicrobiota bacterium]MBT3634798.1 hypothetical protein [Candidatus Neomarinimicrobiota bacterium]MBT3683588.1 hypothetical protein [Candidatus Neomarinimicrobiota bacterium]MBT3760451.1 hypothetical protein [Candidatus Neomarinimicrobiota bacterium]MBT3896597.1 hypothetical protein [Candidatus Neomarinimicrobiota bacterium]
MTEKNISQSEIDVIEKCLYHLTSNPSYSKKIKDAKNAGQEIILNYHTHSGESKYCISILTSARSLVSMMDQASTAKWEELAHIREVGDSIERFIPIMKSFGNLFKISFGLSKLPSVYLDGSLKMRDE